MKRVLGLVLTISLLLAVCVGCKAEIQETTLNGADISKYSIVYSADMPDYNENAANYIQEQILNRTGITLAVKTDTEEIGAYEIIVGETTRPLSTVLDADTEGVEFAIVSDGTSIAMEGDYFVIAAAAYYFVDTYITGAYFTSKVSEDVILNTPIMEAPNNFMLLIGDGMGVYQTELFQYLEAPAGITTDSEDIFYGYMLPYSGKVRTKANDALVTDSAAAGTALATGYKTNNGFIGKDKDGNDIISLTELAVSLGKETAVMSTEELTGATPAAFSAHANHRSDADKIVADQELLTGTILRTLNNSDNDTANSSTIDRVLEMLNNGNDGFFLMYEEAYIDKHCHNNDFDATYKAMYRFNQAIGQFMEFAFYHPDTFVLITADHETGDLQPDENGQLVFNSNNHSGANVYVFAYGDGAEMFDGRVIENVQIPKTIAKMWGIDDFGDASGDPSL